MPSGGQTQADTKMTDWSEKQRKPGNLPQKVENKSIGGPEKSPVHKEGKCELARESFCFHYILDKILSDHLAPALVR